MTIECQYCNRCFKNIKLHQRKCNGNPRADVVPAQVTEGRSDYDLAIALKRMELDAQVKMEAARLEADNSRREQEKQIEFARLEAARIEDENARRKQELQMVAARLEVDKARREQELQQANAKREAVNARLEQELQQANSKREAVNTRREQEMQQAIAKREADNARREQELQQAKAKLEAEKARCEQGLEVAKLEDVRLKREQEMELERLKISVAKELEEKRIANERLLIYAKIRLLDSRRLVSFPGYPLPVYSSGNYFIVPKRNSIDFIVDSISDGRLIEANVVKLIEDNSSPIADDFIEVGTLYGIATVMAKELKDTNHAFQNDYEKHNGKPHNFESVEIRRLQLFNEVLIQEDEGYHRAITFISEVANLSDCIKKYGFVASIDKIVLLQSSYDVNDLRGLIESANYSRHSSLKCNLENIMRAIMEVDYGLLNNYLRTLMELIVRTKLTGVTICQRDTPGDILRKYKASNHIDWDLYHNLMRLKITFNANCHIESDCQIDESNLKLAYYTTLHVIKQVY